MSSSSAPSASLTVPSSSWSSSRDLLSSAIFPFLQFQQELMANCILVDKCWYGAAAAAGHRIMVSQKIEWPFPSRPDIIQRCQALSFEERLHELSISSSPFLHHLTRLRDLKPDHLHKLNIPTSQLRNIRQIIMDAEIGTKTIGDQDWRETKLIFPFPASLRTLDFKLSVKANSSQSMIDTIETVMIRLSRELKIRNPLLESLTLRISTCEGNDYDEESPSLGEFNPCSPPIEFLQNLSRLPALHTYFTLSDQTVTSLSAEQFAVIRTFPALTRLKYVTGCFEVGMTPAEVMSALLPSEKETRQPLQLAMLPFTKPPHFSPELGQVLTQYRWLRELVLITSRSQDDPKKQHQLTAVILPEDDIFFLSSLSQLTNLRLIDSRRWDYSKQKSLPRLSGSTLVSHIGAMVQLTDLSLEYFIVTTDEMTRMLSHLNQLRVLSLTSIVGLDSLSFLPSLARSLCQLDWGQLRDDVKLAPSEIHHIFSLHQLEKLCLSDVFEPELSADFIARLKRDHPEFDHLSIPYLKDVNIW